MQIGSNRSMGRMTMVLLLMVVAGFAGGLYFAIPSDDGRRRLLARSLALALSHSRGGTLIWALGLPIISVV